MSKYILNDTPLRTSNNYKINDIQVDLDITENYDFNDINIISDEIDKLQINKSIENNFNSKINLKLKKYYKLNITVKENIQLNNPVIIEKLIDNDLSVDEINILLEKNSKADFIIKYKNRVKCINNIKQVLNAKENSISNISIVNLIDNNSKSLISIENNIDDNSIIDYNLIDLGGDLRISNYYSKLNGKNSINNFNNIYIGLNNDRMDMNYYIANNNEKTIGNINVQGCLDNNSYKTFKGTIDFIEGSKKSKGDEIENCILLSDTCISRSLPMLLCHEEDVEGSHGVSTGKIDNEKLFYLMSRGITEKEAIKLIINANFNEIINNIPDNNIQNEIKEIIDKKLS